MLSVSGSEGRVRCLLMHLCFVFRISWWKTLYPTEAEGMCTACRNQSCTHARMLPLYHQLFFCFVLFASSTSRSPCTPWMRFSSAHHIWRKENFCSIYEHVCIKVKFPHACMPWHRNYNSSFFFLLSFRYSESPVKWGCTVYHLTRWEFTIFI